MNDVSGRPSALVMAEFHTVARRSSEFLDALAKSNNKPDYCPEQVEDICKTLIALPSGTTIQGREIVDYSGRRLPDLRREMFPFDDQSAPAMGSSIRDDLLDDRLSLLIAAVSTALATIDREAKNRPLPEPPPVYLANSPPSNLNAELAHQAQETITQLDSVDSATIAIGEDNPERFERLRRTISGTRGLHVLARSELLFREIVPGWLRNLRAGIARTPDALRASATAIRKAKAVAVPFYEQWKQIEDSIEKVISKNIDVFARNLETAADIFEGKESITPIKPNKPPLSDDEIEELAKAMILRGEAPPAEWIPSIRHLNVSGEQTFANAEPLKGLVNLTTLRLDNTQISSAEPLKGLVNLTTLWLSNTQISSAEPLKGLVNLTMLGLSNTPVSDISPLRELPRLARINVESRKRAKALLPQLGAGWRIKRKAADEQWYELRHDVPDAEVQDGA